MNHKSGTKNYPSIQTSCITVVLAWLNAVRFDVAGKRFDAQKLFILTTKCVFSPSELVIVSFSRYVLHKIEEQQDFVELKKG